MKDIQSLADSRRIDIKKVGVKTVSYPVALRDKVHGWQHTVAVANMYVNLPRHFKGTHMSRFVEILNDFHGDFAVSDFSLVLEKMKQRLDAQASHLELVFPFFSAQRDGHQRRYQCRLCGSLRERADVRFTVDIPVSLPQSRGGVAGEPVSGSWGKAEVAVRFQRFFWIEDLVAAAERAVAAWAVAAGSTNRGGRLCAEELCRVIGQHLERIDALQSFCITARHFRSSCSTFACLEGRTAQ